MFDLFFLSHGEAHAEVHWAALKTAAPHARRVDGIDGILPAHRRCAALARTAMFWVVDADNAVDRGFRFDHPVPQHDRDYVHLWYARNPLNGLAYGWGGVKLFPRRAVLDAAMAGLDMTTGFPLKVMPEIVSTTHFTPSPLATWRSAFREAAKLAVSADPEAPARLAVWCGTASGPYAAECLRGARDGRAHALASDGDRTALMRINDFAWLGATFERST